MTDLMQQALDTAALHAPPWLQDWLRDGRERWEAGELPTRRTEAWKYTSVRVLDRPWSAGCGSSAGLAGIDGKLPDLGGYRLVFVDGEYRPELSAGTLPEGVTLVRFSSADAGQAARIRMYLGRAARRDGALFTALSDAALADGVFLEIAPGAQVDQTLQVAWITGRQDDAFCVNQRLLVACGANSRARIVEHFASLGDDQAVFTNGVSELLLDSGARLDHYRLHLEEGAAMHIGGLYAHLSDSARLDGFHLAFGSALKRVDVSVEHRGAGAECRLNGIYLPRGREHVDYHTCVEHTVGHCTTDEVFRGIVADEARAVFNGRIHIHPDAQKTRAQLSNRNLLTSAAAEVDTKPELEIYADDVQCAHGATVAQLDETSLHYLRSRGISRAEAEVMLGFGFVNEVLDAVSCEQVSSFLRPLVARRLSRDASLSRHLA